MARKMDLSHPVQADAARIAEIHLAAMDSNPLLHAQFPSPGSLEGLGSFLASHTASQLSSCAPAEELAAKQTAAVPEIGILVARDPDSGSITGFAKFASPRHPEKDGKIEEMEGLYKRAAGCRRDLLEGYASIAEDAMNRLFGDRPCYQLSFVCIDPVYQGRGAGSLLTRSVLDMAAADGLPVYIESTPVAVPMYKKLGFNALGSFEIEIPQRGGLTGGTSGVYKETCMVWYP